MSAATFEYTTYRPFVRARLASAGRGSQKQLADRLRVQPAFVSQVLAGKLEFTPEQALGTALHFDLGEMEREYFLLLVAHARAGTEELRAHLSLQLEGLREKHRLIANRMKMTRSVEQAVRERYYSTWHPAAVHMALTVPAFRTKDALRKAIRIRASKLDEVLEFLVASGFATQKGNEFHATDLFVHLERNSPLLPGHHRNVRLHGLEFLAEGDANDLRYSGYFTCSRADYKKLQEVLLKALADFNDLVRPSKEEMLAGIGIDLFGVSGR